jgi:repressor LexA
MGLTPKQKKVYEFLRDYIQTYGFSPSYDEIRVHFGLRSYNSVQKYLRQLESKGFVRTPWANMKRAVELVEEPARAVGVPLLGTVAAGRPIEAIEVREEIEMPEGLLSGDGHFVLRVKGDSMIADGINDGDLVVVRKQKVAEDGQTVVALIEGEATIKRLYRRGEKVELAPANDALESIFVDADRLELEGVVVALLRRY